MIASLRDGLERKALCFGLDFLQADDVRVCSGEPVQQTREAGTDAIHIEGGNLHTEKEVPQPQLDAAFGLRT